MYATIRRHDGLDQNRIVELSGKVNESLVPKLRKLEGFKGYYLIEGDNGVISELGLFETPEQANASSELAASWVLDEKLEMAFPNQPKITSGRVVTHQNGVVENRVAVA